MKGEDIFIILETLDFTYFLFHLTIFPNYQSSVCFPSHCQSSGPSAECTMTMLLKCSVLYMYTARNSLKWRKTFSEENRTVLNLRNFLSENYWQIFKYLTVQKSGLFRMCESGESCSKWRATLNVNSSFQEVRAQWSTLNRNATDHDAIFT